MQALAMFDKSAFASAVEMAKIMILKSILSAGGTAYYNCDGII
jgi:hypothetical protein